MNFATTKGRILQFIDYKKINNQKFLKETEIKRGFLDGDKLKSSVSDEFIAKIIARYPEINLDWLLTGEGEMLKQAEKTSEKIKLIPFYDAEAEAGTLQMSSMESVSVPVEWINAGDWFRDADSAMRVHGDSMFPMYESGSVVAMREVYDKRLIVYGQDYVIETSEYRVIKRLQKSEEKGCWMACSINMETWERGPLAGRLIHEPFNIYVDDVIKICRVLGCVKRNESSRIVYNKGIR